MCTGLRVKNSGASVLREPPQFPEFYSRKILSCCLQEAGETDHLEIYPEGSVLFNKVLPSKEIILPEPNQCGEREISHSISF